MFVTGSSIGAHDSYDYATVAYNAVTRAQRWAERYDGPGSGDGQAYSAAVSPSGATLFVTGYTDTSSTSAGYDYATVAYNAATGSRLWIRRHDGAPAGPAPTQSPSAAPRVPCSSPGTAARAATMPRSPTKADLAQVTGAAPVSPEGLSNATATACLVRAAAQSLRQCLVVVPYCGRRRFYGVGCGWVAAAP